MQRLRFILPPPGLLIAFEAAGRLLSFKDAAAELNVSRVAVSQQMRALEDHFGVRLFDRMHRAVRLTVAGERYHRSVADALREIVQATADLKRTANDKIVSVSATAGFTTYWLMPNIGSFRRDHPDIELRIVVSDRQLDFFDEHLDVAIYYGSPATPLLNSEHLVQEVIAPACAPGLIGEKEVIAVQDVHRYPLIHLDGPYDEQTRWSHWFRAQQLQTSNDQRGISVNTYTNLVQAALDGQGLALIGTPLIARYLESGALIQPVEAAPIIRRSFYLVTPGEVEPSSSVSCFLKWIREAFVGNSP